MARRSAKRSWSRSSRRCPPVSRRSRRCTWRKRWRSANRALKRHECPLVFGMCDVEIVRVEPSRGVCGGRGWATLTERCLARIVVFTGLPSPPRSCRRPRSPPATSVGGPKLEAVEHALLQSVEHGEWAAVAIFAVARLAAPVTRERRSVASDRNSHRRMP
jgi:hypothetical protein